MTDKVTEWTYDDWDLLQMSICSGYVAVYTATDKVDPEHLTLISLPIDAFALARKTTYSVQGVRGKEILRKRKESSTVDVVGLILSEGYFQIVNEDSNFCGLCREGDDLAKATGCLQWEQLEKLTPELRKAARFEL